MRHIASDVNVVAVESVKKIFECNNRFNVLELTKNALNLVTTDLLELFASDLESLLPVKVCERAVLLTDHWHGESLLLKAVEGVARLVTDPLLVNFLVNAR